MMFHPDFSFVREHRSVFITGAPGAAPQTGGDTPKTELPPEQKKAKEVVDVLKDTLKTSPNNLNAIKELAAMKFEEAEADERKFQEAYHSALEKAANAYFKTLEGTEEEKVKKVNELFQGAGAPGVKLENGVLVLGSEEPKDMEEAEEGVGRPLTDAEKAFIRNAFSNPDQAAVAERVMSKMVEGTPEFQTAKGLYESFNTLDPKERQAVLTNPQAREKFRNALPADQRKFMDKLAQDLTAASKELSEEERGDIIEGAEKELQKFDATKATEIDKNIMLARMQMRGIDTSDPDAIFKKPPELKVFKGSSVERGFHQIMGLIGYVLLSIQKMKDMMKPKEKGTDAPAGDKGKAGPEAPSPEKEARRQQLREQSKRENKPLGQIRADKQGRLDQLTQKELPGLRSRINEIHDANEEAGLKDEDNTDLQKLTPELKKAKAEAAILQSETGELDAMKQESSALSHTLNQDKILLSEIIKGLPDGARKTQLMESLRFTVEPNGQYQLIMKPDAGLTIEAAKANLNVVLSGRLAKGLSESIHFDGTDVLKTPTELQQVLGLLTQNIREEITRINTPLAGPAAAPAPASAAPAGPAPAPPAAPPTTPAPGASEGAGKK
ncbi:MAG: hypothetical protein PHX93_03950 [Candidatus Peribacteraceae bacterium]|jgi:hypothetical protein|nr:hypothetical protein [Candidatus Peribacteraceae bacterium]